MVGDHVKTVDPSVGVVRQGDNEVVEGLVELGAVGCDRVAVQEDAPSVVLRDDNRRRDAAPQKILQQSRADDREGLIASRERDGQVRRCTVEVGPPVLSNVRGALHFDSPKDAWSVRHVHTVRHENDDASSRCMCAAFIRAMSQLPPLTAELTGP